MKKESSVAPLFMMVSKDIRLPEMKPFQPVLALHMNCWKPIPVKVEPIVIEPSAGPHFTELTRVGITNEVLAFMLVHPGGKTLQSVWVKRWIEENDFIVPRFGRRSDA